MKKVLVILPLVMLGAACNTQTSYSLDWIIDDGDVIAYSTTMEVADPTITINFDDLSALLNGEADEQISDLEFALPASSSLISILELNERGNIAVKMIVHQVETVDQQSDNELGQELNQLMTAMVGTVQLRGELTPEGDIASFYLAQNQRNLLAMFFQLPTTPVQVGDSWQLDMHCIEMDTSFVAHDAQRINRVEFSELSETASGQPIAVLDYVIAETVDGEIQSPFSSEKSPVAMECSFIGRGEFLIEEGRWERFTGEFTARSTGLMESDATQRFALTLLEEVPPEYLDLQ